MQLQPVNVVNRFFREKIPPQLLFQDKTVFQDYPGGPFPIRSRVWVAFWRGYYRVAVVVYPPAFPELVIPCVPLRAYVRAGQIMPSPNLANVSRGNPQLCRNLGGRPLPVR